MKTILLLTTIVTLTLPTLFSQPATAQGRSTVLTSGTMLADAKLTVEQLIERAESKVTAQDYQGAIKDYTLAIEMKPDKLAPIHMLRGNVHVMTNNDKLAFADFDQAVKLAPNDAETYMVRAFFFSTTLSPEKAILDYKKALELNPKNPEPYSWMGSIYAGQGNHGEAIKVFSQYLKMKDAEMIAPNHYNDRGLSYHAIGDYQNAIADFNQAIKTVPLYGSSYYHRGLTYQAMGQKQEALADFKRTLEVEKEHPEAEEIMKKIKELQ